jgi:hypothetical protein
VLSGDLSRDRRTWTDDELRRAVKTSTSWRGVLRSLGFKATSAGSVMLARQRATQLGLDTGHFRGNRQWTDEQLVAALEKSHSWCGVLRELGLKPTSTTSKRGVQQRISQLGLDASHVTGKRRWTDKDLRDAVACSQTWAEVTAMLGYDSSTSGRATIKSHAARLGLDLSHLSTVGPVLPATEVPPVDLANLRSAAPSIALTWFTLRGQPPSVPLEPQRYDMVVETSRGFKRVQVKSTTFFANGAWQVGVSHRPDKNGKREPYSPDDVDLFFIIDGEMNLYLIPIDALGGRIAINLRAYENFRVGHARSMIR